MSRTEGRSPSRGQSPAAVAGWLRGRALSLAETVTTPLLPDDYLDLVNPLRAGARLRGRVLDVRKETADSASLLIRPGRDWRGHTPGQYVRLGIDVEGVRLWRAYSLTSLAAPHDARRGPAPFTITVKAMPDGVVSNHLVHRTQPGAIVQLDQPCGDFVLPDPLPARSLFLTAGSGVTPVMGMLRNHGHALRDAVVVHSAPTRDEVIFGPELRRMAADGRIRLLERHTDTEGMLTADDLLALVPDLDERETWACGPTGLLDTAAELWESRGATDRLHTERFRPTVLTTGEGGTVSFTRSGVDAEAPGNTPLLEVGEEAGVLMPSGCRMGICYGCVTPLRQGSVRDLRDGSVVTAVPGDDVLVQTCVSAAAGACELDR
ncbi:ferredoxin reductase [Streptomyces sp. XM4193]|uniref:ferredoxin reductase n=1 Tax=Streptomyces sp. XM4193 TaxID=2929782 RepID=UPI001FF9EBDD|nr:ferredoxin reductase [Streptomyces sp. XM4193]MCK1795023.1 ferredoxin reductase [Streptomyces sp. XM4193]